MLANRVVRAVAVLVIPLSSVTLRGGQPEPPKAGTSPTTSPAATAAATAAEPKLPSRAELEAEFQKSLTGAVLSGTWQMTGKSGLSGNDPLSEPKPDKYTISGAAKVNNDTWLINARIEFGEKDVTVPVPVRVIWAEDTAMITVTDLALPMIGTYSARVMFHKGFYTGIWYCGAKNYGGVMSGRILKEEAAAKESATGTPASPAAPAEKGK